MDIRMSKQAINQNDVVKAAEEQYKQAESEKEVIVKEYEDICAQMRRATGRIKDSNSRLNKAEAMYALEDLEDARKVLLRKIHLASAKQMDAYDNLIKENSQAALDELPSICESMNKAVLDVTKTILDLSKATMNFDILNQKYANLIKETEKANLVFVYDKQIFHVNIDEIRKFIQRYSDTLESQNHTINKPVVNAILKEHIDEARNLARPE
jgi:hypothetical protein